MKLYHGTSRDKAQKLIATGRYEEGQNDNSWSAVGGEDGLFCSNIYEYAEQYGSAVIEIDVEDGLAVYIQDCPLSEDDYGWRPEFDGAIEYLIPAGITFVAKEA